MSSSTQLPTKIDLSNISQNEPAATHTSSKGVGLSGSGRGPTSPQLEKDAARAMSRTESWKPDLGDRRQSYSQEDKKRRDMMMMTTGDVKEGPGFSEKK